MRFINKFKIYLLLIFIILIGIHFTIKDNFFPVSIIYYAFPPLFLIVLGIVVSFFYFKEKKAFYSLILFSSFLIGYWFNNYYSFEMDSKTSNIKDYILFWNVSNKSKFPTKILIEKAINYSPNVIALVETRNITKENLNELKSKLLDYSFKELKGEMFIAVKGKINAVAYHSNKNRVNFNFINATIDNQKSTILVTDVYAWPLVNKKFILKELFQFANNKNASFVVGDFNTPYESVHFEDYRKYFNNFHLVSQGFTATWPDKIPLWEIDQIWINSEIMPITLKKYYYQNSDHALLVGGYNEKTSN